MKKENKEIARKKKAAARKKQERNNLLRQMVIIGAPVLLACAFIGFLIYEGVKESDGNKKSKKPVTEAETSYEVKDFEDYSDIYNNLDEQETKASTYITDTSEVVQYGDTVNIDYVGSVDGVEFEGGNTMGYGANLEIGSHTYIDDFEDQLVGKHVGDNVDVYATFPEGYGNEMLDGKEALFKVTINGIYR